MNYNNYVKNLQTRIDMIKFLTYCSDQKGKLLLSGIFSIAGSIFHVAVYFLIFLLLIRLVDKDADTTYLWIVAAILPVVFILTTVFRALTMDLSHIAAYDALFETRLVLGKKLLRIPLGYVNGQSSGELKTIINENVERMELFIAHHLPELMGIVIVPVLFFIALIMIDPYLAAASVFPVAGALFLIYVYLGKKTSMAERTLKAQAAVSTATNEYVQGIKIIKVYHGTAYTYNRYAYAVKEYRDSLLHWFEMRKYYFRSYHALLEITPGAILVVGVVLYGTGSLPVESLLLFLLVGPIFASLFSRIYDFLEYWQDEKVSAEKIESVMNIPELPDSPVDNIPSAFDITFDKVTFSYDDKPVLDNVSFRVRQGTWTAIVGPSGAGKSTIARLIPRFWDIQKGEIRIGEFDIRDIRHATLNSFIAIVFQEVYLFNDTIAENIRIGRPDATDEEVAQAAKASRCHEFIEKLPTGYATVVGEKGVKLSGGEKQRISIARALLKNAPIIVMDEATSMLDVHNERLIREAIDRLTRGKTVLIIAHRLSTVTGVDQILVLEDGRIVEQGTHDSILNAGGLYQKLWQNYTSAQGWKIRSR